MKKLVSLLLVLVMVLGLCVGCGAKDELDIGIVLPTKDEDRWLADEAKFLELIEEKGYKAEIMYSQADPGIEKTNVEALIEKGMKVLIICPFDGAAAASTVSLAVMGVLMPSPVTVTVLTMVPPAAGLAKPLTRA